MSLSYKRFVTDIDLFFFTPRGFSLGTPVLPQNANAIGKR